MLARTAIDRYLRQLEGSAKPVTVRQRRWALQRMVLAAAVHNLLGPRPAEDALLALPASTLAAAVAGVTLDDLLASGTPVSELLELAVSPALGRLNGRAAATSPASLRALGAALRALAAHAGRPHPLADPGPAEVRALVPFTECREALTTLQRHPVSTPAAARFVALASVAAATGLGPVALAHQQVADLSDLLSGLSRGQPAGAEALQVWLAHRRALVERLEGSVRALWVSLKPNHDPLTGTPRPPGLPLKPRGLERAWSSAAVSANSDLAGSAGFPLPLSLSLWARSSFQAPLPHSRP